MELWHFVVNTTEDGCVDVYFMVCFRVFREMQRVFGHLLHSQLQYFEPDELWHVFKLWGQGVNVREQQVHDSLCIIIPLFILFTVFLMHLYKLYLI